MKALFTCVLLVLTVQISFAQDLQMFFNDADVFLQSHVENGSVDYKKAMEDPALLNSLVNQIAGMDLDRKNNSEQRAFYINAYNLLVINMIVRNYPLNSPMDVKGFFDVERNKITGELLTLNEIENKKLREAYSYDPRFHFVLVCAAKGCPQLISEAYMPETIERQLSNQTRASINDSKFIRVNKKEQSVEVSQIFEWYIDDFKNKGTLEIDFINRYRKYPIPDTYKLSYYQYDWELNELNR